ncbi:Mobile element protein (plasmid) [Nostoc flagelliforme CCNUN1]|uniref:Harbinger transposase-derived nuclease domain n=1 Tax=Nostoc flagelliforme CCNUN1 TaxID=2038116 RepID=A0A2K8T683_9NOSO|nr:Harbinger transposase-derived nuclease domain [Nostoc flagelliforme CCNUN1]AUB43854.1 Mobile element protein [Nostoc flagelliforme CCNUN1]
MLVQQAKLINQEQLAEVERKKVRVNAPGGGRKPKLTLEESVCLCLFYLRQMPTFEILGIHFDVSKTEANDTFHYWIKILRVILPSSLLEQVEAQESEMMIVQELLTEFELIVDSMEQPRERPRDNKEQKKYFSGKKKQHTFKNQVVSMPEAKEIVDVVVGVKGPTSDISLFRKQQQKFAAEQSFQGDKAYIGGTNISTPHKKPRNGKLTAEQKEENKVFSSNRVFVEHIIRVIKIFRVASERFRLHPDTYEQVILTVCGLVRLRISSLILPGLS